MSTLNVPGTRLDYRVVGEGPLLALIAGAGGRAPSATRSRSTWRPVAAS